MRASGARLVAVAVAVTTVLAASRARAEHEDPWLGRDKALHFGACALFASGGYGLAAIASDDARVRLGVGAAAGLGAGVAKELWDLSGHGDASWRDLTWDVAGTATGLAVAALVDWTLGKLSGRRAARTP